MENLAEKNKEEIVSHILNLLPIWDKMASSLIKTFVILGIVAIGSSLFVTTFANEKNILVVKICSFTTTLLLTLLTSFNLSKKANGVRNGWRHVNAAYFKYKANGDIDAFIKAYEEGEIMLGSVDFNYDTTQLKGMISKTGEPVNQPPQPANQPPE